MIHIFATDLRTGERIEISGLYWFEERGVRDWRGHGFHEDYRFEVFIDDNLVWTSDARRAWQD